MFLCWLHAWHLSGFIPPFTGSSFMRSQMGHLVQFPAEFCLCAVQKKLTHFQCFWPESVPNLSLRLARLDAINIEAHLGKFNDSHTFHTVDGAVRMFDFLRLSIPLTEQKCQAATPKMECGIAQKLHLSPSEGEQG